ncbi:YihY family inner membrane protein [Pedobacter sp. HMF7647]|uniref:YihY family inner membrane protein n=1 Tax=Hufsiella arboris TaxID=2695275 RepID=A0A7K1Y7U3_9SPHI|nr:YihY/virulence factor BrkB family protein [Hufsiella arboris]MXV50441.1 YihY family inner membrane protein [Hufsiella arboris]
MNWLHKQLCNVKPYRQFIEWTKVVVFPGFSPLPIYTVAVFFFREIGKDSLVNKASSLAYSFMLAIFPAIIFLFTLIPYVPIAHFQDQLMEIIHSVLPNNAYLAVESTIKDIVKIQNSSLLSLGFITALFFATNGVHNLMQAFNKSSLILETRGWLKRRAVALALTLLMVMALIISITILTISEYIFSYLQKELTFKESFWITLIGLGRWIILIGMYLITISLLYRYGPANAKKWKLFSAGSWLATLLAMLTSWGFAFYINNFSNYNKLYGSIGTLIVIMIWLYLNSLIILIGFELNASLDLSKKSIRIIKPMFNSFKEPVEETLKK